MSKGGNIGSKKLKETGRKYFCQIHLRISPKAFAFLASQVNYFALSPLLSEHYATNTFVQCTSIQYDQPELGELANGKMTNVANLSKDFISFAPNYGIFVALAAPPVTIICISDLLLNFSI